MTKNFVGEVGKEKKYNKKATEDRRQKIGVEAQLPQSVKDKQLRCAYGVLDSLR